MLAQRLARKLCTHCSEPYTPSEEELLALHIGPERAAALADAVFHRKHGCTRCSETGYHGRVGIFQFLEDERAPSSASRRGMPRATRSSASPFAEGMRSLWDNGIAKIAAGLTTAGRLARVATM